jgi:hypothetical protein
MTKLLRVETRDRMFVGNRGLLHDRDDTRSSPYLSMIALGCLNEGDKRGDRYGRYSSWLSLRLEMDPITRIGYKG